MITDFSPTKDHLSTTKENITLKISKQLTEVRSNLHLKYINSKEKVEQNDISLTKKNVGCDEKSMNDVVCGDSMTNGIDSKGISSKNVKAIVRSFPGATSSDMVDFVKPFVDKKPDLLLVHVGTNDLTKKVENTVFFFTAKSLNISVYYY